MTRSSLLSTRIRLAVAMTAMAVAAAVTSGAMATASSPEELKAQLAGRPALTLQRYEATANLMGPDLREALGIDSIAFIPTETQDGRPTSRIVDADNEDPALAYCGFSGTGTMVVRFGQELRQGYCISGLIEGDPTSVFFGRAIAARLLNDRIPSDAELDVLRLRMELLFDKDAAGLPLTDSHHAEISERLDRLWEGLTTEQRAWLED